MLVEILREHVGVGGKKFIILGIDTKELIIFSEEVEFFLDAVVVGRGNGREIFKVEDRVHCKVIASIISDWIDCFVPHNEGKPDFLIQKGSHHWADP